MLCHVDGNLLSMPHPDVIRAREWLRAHETDLLADTVTMLKIPSIEGPAEPNAPFGAENRKALDFALELGAKWGMKIKDIEGYAGFAEFGSGERLVMSLGHLDVVPVSNNWKHAPFGAEIEDGYIYARGSTDDKGPTMAAFYAVRALMETCPEIGEKARLRLVFGCDEESGFGCIHRYCQTEEAPTFGIAPDSSWPLVHAEKGIANIVVQIALNKGSFQLRHLEGGQRPNIVIDECVATVEVQPVSKRHVEAKLADAWDRNVSFSWEGSQLKIVAKGKAAHGSVPFGGDSAATRILRFMYEIAPLDSQEWFSKAFWTTHSSGVGLGIHGRDDVSSDLTNNIGVITTEGNNLEMLFNIRYPVTWQGADLSARCASYLETLGPDFFLKSFDDSPSLYFPLDHPLVDTIRAAYCDESGEDIAPGVMGGGTYARAIPNTVSVGTSWEGDGPAHENDERYKIAHLFRASRIYADILYRLATR